MHPPCPLPPPESPDPAQVAAWQAELAAAQTSPWLASLFMRRFGAVRTRLTELRDWLARLPRRMRRGWARAWLRRVSPVLPIGALVLALAAGQAHAATITVDPGGSGCTLEDAITAANDDLLTGSCPAGDLGADTINFANPNTSYFLNAAYGTALPDINSPITIQGNGNTTLDAEGAFRVLHVIGGGSLLLSNATITGGSASGEGGGILVNTGTLVVTSATISGNQASTNGGGIAVISGSVSLTSATISSNQAAYDGGGIFAENSTVHLRNVTVSGNSAQDDAGGLDLVDGTSADILNSTISGNSAQDAAGGIRLFGNSVHIENSTISGNSAQYDAGGIGIGSGSATLVNVTVSGNSAGGTGGGINAFSITSLTHVTVTGNSAGSSGGGLFVYDTSVFVQSSILAGQAAGTDCSGGTIISGGYNIEGATSCGFTDTGDLQSQAGLVNLGPLAPNPPGTTQTHALGPGSSALNHIPPSTNGCGTTITTDQRGVTRPQEGACDVGAYEFLPAAPTPTPTAIAPTAARVTHFAAAPDPSGRVRITWETASEVDVVGFRVMRAPVSSDAWTDVGGLTPARGSAAGGARYTATDLPGVGSFAYRLEIVEAHGPPSTHGPATAIVRALRAFLPVGWR